jgi:hypothetical protein
MSLIEIRRDRKRQSGGPTRPPSLWKLLLALILVAYLIWYLSRFGGGG